jgi:hypothetical protein
MAKKVPNLPGLQVPADVPTVERLQEVPVYPSKIGNLLLLWDFTGTTKNLHPRFRELMAEVINWLLVNFPEAARRMYLSFNAISSGVWPSDYQSLADFRLREFEAGGDSPILESASIVGARTLAQHREMLKTTRIVAHYVMILTDCIDKIQDERGQVRAAQGWQDFMASSPLTRVQLIVPEIGYPKSVAKLLLRPEQTLDEVVVLDGALSMGPKLMEQFAIALRDVSKTVTGDGSNKRIKAPLQPMVLSTEE